VDLVLAAVLDILQHHSQVTPRTLPMHAFILCTYKYSNVRPKI
jgi:hypothetical protein